MTSDSSSLPSFDFSRIDKEMSLETGRKLIKITGTLHGHDVTLILSLDPSSKRDEVITKLKTSGLTFTGQLGADYFTGSTGDKKQTAFFVKIDTKEKSFNFSKISGSKLLLKQQTTEKVKKFKEQSFRDKGSYTTLAQTPYELSIRPPTGKENTTLPPIPTEPLPLPPVPKRAAPLPSSSRAESSMEEEVMKSSYFRSDMNPVKAAAALQHPAILPGTVMICKSYSYPKYPFIASVKLPNGTVSQSIVMVEKTDQRPVYRIRDTLTLDIKVGGGTGYVNIVDCVGELSRFELARSPPVIVPLPALMAAQPAAVSAKASLEVRATQLFQNLQGMRGPLQEMGQSAGWEGILKNLCYDIAAFERSGLNEKRVRKNTAAFAELGVTLPFTFLLTKYQGTVQIQMTTPGVVQGAVIGTGSYKVVKSNHIVNIPAAGSTQMVAIRSQELVLLRAKKGNEADVRKGIDMINRLRQEIGPDVIPPVYLRTPYRSKDLKYERIEYAQRQFNGDFEKVVKNGELPLKKVNAPSAAVQPGPAGMMKLTIRNKLEMLIDVSAKIARFHTAGYIHRDVKPPNMLIDLNTSQTPPRIVAIPADYDLTRRAGFADHGAEGKIYCYWDPLSREGLVTPNSDVYGLAYSLGETLFPNFMGIIGHRTQIDPNLDFAKLMFHKLDLKLKELGVLNPAGQQLLRDLSNPFPLAYQDSGAKVYQYLNDLSGSRHLTPEQVQLIREFQAEVSIMPVMWEIILRVMNQSAELQRDVLSNKNLVQKFKNPQQAQEASDEVMAMARHRHIPTADQFSKFLQHIRGQMG